MSLLPFVILLFAIGALYAMRFPPCNLNKEWLDTSEKPPMCKTCSLCPKDEAEIAPCTETKDRVCSFCELGYVWSDLESFCRPCGCCSGKHKVQEVCLAAGLSVNKACIADGPCPSKASNVSSPVSSPSPAANIAAITSDQTNGLVVAFGIFLGIGLFLGAAIVIATILYCKKQRRKTKKANQQPLPLVEYPPQDEELPLPTAETSGDQPVFSGDYTALPGPIITGDQTTAWNSPV